MYNKWKKMSKMAMTKGKKYLEKFTSEPYTCKSLIIWIVLKRAIKNFLKDIITTLILLFDMVIIGSDISLLQYYLLIYLKGIECFRQLLSQFKTLESITSYIGWLTCDTWQWRKEIQMW